MRSLRVALFAAFVVVLTFGCGKSEPTSSTLRESTTRFATASTGTVVQVHWLGGKQLAVGTNATNLISLWNLPESAKLKAQTLETLSLAPWRLLRGDAATNGAPTELLRALFDDLVREEFCLEGREVSNQQHEFALAIRLGNERGSLWVTNLATVLESLTGMPATRTEGGGWLLKKHEAPNLIELTRAGEWTVVGWAQDTNILAADMLARIDRGLAPSVTSGSNYWLEAEFDVPRIARLLSLNWRLQEELHRISVAISGNGGGVRMQGEAQLAKPLATELPPWNIPTNLIHDPLTSFAAARGLKPWFTSLARWDYSKFGDPPDQLFFWGQQGVPLQTFFCAPLADASNRVQKAAQTFLGTGNAWLETNGMGQVELLAQGNGVGWTGVPFISLQLRPVTTPGGGFVMCGLAPNVGSNLPPPAELVQTILGWTNLVLYEWEITEPRVEAWIYLSQVMRLAFQKAQLPRGSSGLEWLKAVAPKLGNSVAVATLNGPDRISFVRQSTIGLSSVELALLADWLESPRFPVGLHTFLSPGSLPPRTKKSPATAPNEPNKP
jgi:hypothetical protein